MDRLSKSQSEILAKTRKYLINHYPASFGYILYDLSTLYFKRDHEDEDDDQIPGLKKKGTPKTKETI